MSTPSLALTAGVEARARQSLGSSHDAIYQMVAAAIERHQASRGRIVDVGCGSGGLFQVLGHRFQSYCGLDAVRYDGLPAAAEFHRVDLDAAEWPALPSAGVVAAVETIEHLENPWAFMRHLAGLSEMGGLVVVTTPNQLSLLSLVTLLIRRRFSAFQDAHFPTHRTALLESDLVRAAAECGLDVLEVGYTHRGRLPLTPWHYPAVVARLAPRRLSDNLMVVARRSRG
jgi:2-polyprenyl-3-methyl-5-hydroxy-6-metoxy-1,4-benzoquinol methylase